MNRDFWNAHTKRQVEDEIVRIEVLLVVAPAPELERRVGFAPERGREHACGAEFVVRGRVRDLERHVGIPAVPEPDADALVLGARHGVVAAPVLVEERAV